MNTRVWNISLGEEQKIDRGILTGVGICVALIVIGIVSSGKGLNFLSPTSFLLVLGGTVGATLVNFSMYDFNHAIQAFKSAILVSPFHPIERIQYLVRLAQLVRQEGLLILDREAQISNDPFLRLALELTVDGQPPAEIKRVLETEMISSNDRESRAVQIFQTMGNYAPAMGLIGTLIGLIQMLGNLQNPASVGPAMSLALVATFYGAIFANLFFLPIAGKIKARNEEQTLVKAITVEGILNIGRQENPIVLEQRLQGFLPLCKQ